jgi:hypothetical protein
MVPIHQMADIFDGILVPENSEVLAESDSAGFHVVKVRAPSGMMFTYGKQGSDVAWLMRGSGDNAEVLVRYQEYNINGDSIKTTNRTPAFATLCDKFSVNNYQGTYIASFIYGRMYNYYGSKTVPGGWLVPLKYIRLGRPVYEDDKYATVRLIVPHDQGTAAAVSGVYACYYYMTYEVDR